MPNFPFTPNKFWLKTKNVASSANPANGWEKELEIVLYPSFTNFSIFKQGIISLKFKDLLSFSQAPLEIQATFLLQNLHFYSFNSFLLFYYFTRFSIWVAALRSPRVWLGSCLNLEPAASKPNGGQAHPYRRRHQPCRHNVQDKGQCNTCHLVLRIDQMLNHSIFIMKNRSSWL